MDEQFITCVTCLLRSLCYRIARLIAGINSQVHQLNSIPPAFKYYSGIYFYGVYIYCRCTYYTSHADSMIISRVCQPGRRTVCTGALGSPGTRRPLRAIPIPLVRESVVSGCRAAGGSLLACRASR